MIYTITCNPALDCTLRMGGWRGGAVHNSEGEFSPGGKGINVSRVLTALRVDNRALGFVAGDNGVALERALLDRGVRTEFIRLPEGETRINVKISGPTEMEKNGVGVPIPEAALEQLERQLTDLVAADDVVCLCGSLPPKTPSDTYGRLVLHLRSLGVTRIVVDTSGEPLTAALVAKPWLIKPNREELAAAVERDLPTIDSVADAARELMAQGAQNVLVTLGGDGALLCIADGRVRYQPAPDGTVIGTVGAGDSTVAGFLTEYLRSGDWDAALRYGVVCGSATAFSEGLADAAMIEKMKNRI